MLCAPPQVGYKAAMQGKDLNLSLGYAHQVIMQVPEGLAVKVSPPPGLITFNRQCINTVLWLCKTSIAVLLTLSLPVLQTYRTAKLR